MFFVTILLNELVAWMRTQPGTSSLRAVMYMDEIFGYFPPTANPPSKTPMLTLLKQARAFGLGCVLATQNPVDLDYKGLSNTGTWFIGRLQTERDKARVLDGLEGASGTAGGEFDRQKMESTLAGLGNRVFLMNNVHEDAPVLFQTRWAMSYLRGPLTRTQIETLMKDRKQAAAEPAAAEAKEAAAVAAQAVAPVEPAEETILPAGISQRYMALKREPDDGCRLLYRPAIVATTRLHFAKARAKVDEWQTLSVVAPPPGDDALVAWDEATFAEGKLNLAKKPEKGGQHGVLPEAAAKKKNYKTWEKELKTHLYQSQAMTIWKCPQVKTQSKPGETEGEFRVRLKQVAFEKRDLAIEKARKKYAPKVARIQERIRKAEQALAREKEQYKSQKWKTAISFGATLMGAMLGRKAASVGNVTRAGSTVKSAGRIGKEKQDIGRAKENIAALQQKLVDMEKEFEDVMEEIREKMDPESLELEDELIRPRKSDIGIRMLSLGWVPWQVDADGIAAPLS